MGRAWRSSAKWFRPLHCAASPITYKRHLARVRATFSRLGLPEAQARAPDPACPRRRAQHQEDNLSLLALEGVHGAAVNRTQAVFQHIEFILIFSISF